MLLLLLFVVVYLFLIAVQSSPLQQHLSFQDWLVDEAKVDLHPSVQFLNTGKRGVITLNPLKKDVIVARIPLSSCISDATATKYFSGQFSEYGAFVKMAIFLHLISTKSNDHNASSALSYWYPFVNWMSVPNTPMLWSKDDLHYYLNGTSLKNEILNRIRLTNNIGKEMQQKGYNIDNIYNDQDHQNTDAHGIHDYQSNVENGNCTRACFEEDDNQDYSPNNTQNTSEQENETPRPTNCNENVNRTVTMTEIKRKICNHSYL